MLSTFTNIDSQASSKTGWKSDIHNAWFSSLGNANEYRLGYTAIEAEIPLVTTGDNSAYWSGSVQYKTKLSTCNVFTTRYTYNPETFTARMNGEVIEVTHGTGNFTVPVMTDGYLFVSYVPSESQYFAGNLVSSINAAGIRAGYHTPAVKSDHISRCRKAINNLQYHAEYPISPWTGGAWNSERSSAYNIIPSRTEIFIDHIIEMQSALRNVLAKINQYNPANETSSFSISLSNINVAEELYFRVEYVEEIRKAINDLEGEIIRKLSL